MGACCDGHSEAGDAAMLGRHIMIDMSHDREIIVPVES
jgi:hypothetical protein